MSFRTSEQKIAEELTATLAGIAEEQVEQLMQAIQQAEKVFFCRRRPSTAFFRSDGQTVGHIGIQDRSCRSNY